MRHRRDIDGLRALAVLPVVLFHANRDWFPGGFVGVDVFFVISGFLVARILVAEFRADTFSIWRFYDRRIRRLLPAFFFFLIISTAVAGLLLLPSEMQLFAQSAIASTLFVSNIAFWRSSNYFGPDAEANPLLHTWSLSVEEQYYVLFPIALVIIFRLGWSRFLPLLILTTAAASLILAESLASRAPVASFYLLPTRAWELLAGAWLASRSAGPAPTRTLANVAAGCGLLLIVTPMILYDDQTRFPGLGALPVCVGTMLLLWSGDRIQTWVSSLLSIRPLVWVGLISYSLYLWHWPLLVFPAITLQRDLTVPELMGLIAATVAISAFSWRYIERPFRRSPPEIRGWKPEHASVALGVTAIAVAVLAVAPLLDGGPWRTPALVNQLDAASAPPAAVAPCDAFLDRPRDCPRTALPVVLLWGDSHAGHYHQALADLGRERGFAVRIASLAGCAPLPHSEITSPQGARDNCQRFNRRVLQGLQESVGVRMVVLSGRWNRFFFDRADPEVMALRSPDSGARTQETLLEDGLQATLEDLSRLGLVSAVIGPGPEFLLPLPNCLARPTWHGKPARNCLLHPATLPGGKGDAVVAAVLARQPDTLTIRPYDSLCPRDHCQTVINGEPVLIDTDHLGYRAATRILRSAAWPELEQQNH